MTLIHPVRLSCDFRSPKFISVKLCYCDEKIEKKVSSHTLISIKIDIPDFDLTLSYNIIGYFYSGVVPLLSAFAHACSQPLALSLPLSYHPTLSTEDGLAQLLTQLPTERNRSADCCPSLHHLFEVDITVLSPELKVIGDHNSHS